MKKIVTIFLMLVIIISFINVFNVEAAVTVTVPTNDTGLIDDNIKTFISSIWLTIVPIVQILSVACVVLAGLRYMLSSADTKAEIKKSTTYLVIGALLVFGATTIVNLSVKIFSDVRTGI